MCYFHIQVMWTMLSLNYKRKNCLFSSRLVFCGYSNCFKSTIFFSCITHPLKSTPLTYNLRKRNKRIYVLPAQSNIEIFPKRVTLFGTFTHRWSHCHSRRLKRRHCPKHPCHCLASRKGNRWCSIFWNFCGPCYWESPSMHGWSTDKEALTSGLWIRPVGMRSWIP